MFVLGCGLDNPFGNYFGMMGMVWGLGVCFGIYFVYVGVGLWTEHLFRKLVCVCCDWAANRTFDFSLWMLGLGCPVKMQMFHIDYVISTQHIFSMCLNTYSE